jgi:hypothetical protein
MTRVFLGGTCNQSTWRDELIDLLEVDYFNPVVENWTPECQETELLERQTCDICLYVITPLMTGVYSIAEVVDDSNKRSEKTVFVVLDSDNESSFSEHQVKSLNMVGRLVTENGGQFFSSLQEAANYINKV